MFNLYTKLTNRSLSPNWYFVFSGQRMYVYTSHMGLQVLCTPTY